MRKYFIIAALFICSIPLFSQSFKGGIYAGLTASQVSGDSYAGFNRLGGLVGAYASLPISEKADVELNLLFIQKGSHHNPNADQGDYMQYSLRLNYVEIPIVFSFPLPGMFSGKLRGELGSSFAHLLSSTEYNSMGPVNPKLFSKSEYNFITGLKYPLNAHLDVEFRYFNTWFFHPIREHEGGGRHYLNWGQYNTVCALSLRYNISHTKSNEN